MPKLNLKAFNTPIVLDCTLRDGGYYNLWDFPLALVGQYLRAMSLSEIGFVELGYRQFQKPGFMGPFAYVSDDFLRSLNLPKNLNIAVMIDAKDFINQPSGGSSKATKLFVDSQKSPVGMVRIAAHIHEVAKCGELAKTLHQLGYLVSINVMQATECSENELTQIAKTIQNFAVVDIIYFADSLGNLTPDRVSDMVCALRKGWTGNVGFHGHDNTGRALINTLAAFEEGVCFLDSTILGMGRGAGNTSTELLLQELRQTTQSNIPMDALCQLAYETFTPLKNTYQWGSNLFYHLAAQKSVHPTYVQEMLSLGNLGVNEMLHLIEWLGETDARHYSANGIRNSFAARYSHQDGSWNPKMEFSGRSFLLVSHAEGAANRWSALQVMADKLNLVRLGLHFVPFAKPGELDLIAISHPGYLLNHLDQPLDRTRLVCPPWLLEDDFVKRRLNGRVALTYGLKVEEGVLKAGSLGCVVPEPYVAAYCLSIAAAAGAEQIYLAGFDGFRGDEVLNKTMERLFFLFRQTYPHIPVMALTPTRYGVDQGSVYAFL